MAEKEIEEVGNSTFCQVWYVKEETAAGHWAMADFSEQDVGPHFYIYFKDSSSTI